MFVLTFLQRFTTAENAEQLRSLMGITAAEAQYMIDELSAGTASPTFSIENTSDSEEASFGLDLTLPSGSDYNAFRYLFRQVNNRNYSSPYVLPQDEQDNDNLDSTIKLVFNSSTNPVIPTWTHSDSFTGQSGNPIVYTLSDTPTGLEGVYINGVRIDESLWSLSNDEVTVDLTGQTVDTIAIADTVQITYRIV